jgi:hypothetical protein
MNYNSPHTLQRPSSSPSEPTVRSLSPSPTPSSNSSQHHVPPLPLPIPSPSYNTAYQTHFQRQVYPTSSPYQQQPASPDPSPGSKIRLPPPTSLFTTGYASPAMSTYSSEPGSRDEVEMMEPGSLGGSFPGHGNGRFAGVDSLLLRERMDFQLVQTVGLAFYERGFLIDRNRNIWSCISSEVRSTYP